MSKNFLNLMREFEGLFGDDVFPTYNNLRLRYTPLNRERSGFENNLPPTNVFEDEWVYKFEIVTPGLTKEDISVDIKGETLTFKASKEVDKTDKGGYITKEYHYHKFERSFEIPSNVVSEEIYAKTENGITTIFLPKEKPTKTKSYTRKVNID